MPPTVSPRPAGNLHGNEMRDIETRGNPTRGNETQPFSNSFSELHNTYESAAESNEAFVRRLQRNKVQFLLSSTIS